MPTSRLLETNLSFHSDSTTGGLVALCELEAVAALAVGVEGWGVLATTDEDSAEDVEVSREVQYEVEVRRQVQGPADAHERTEQNTFEFVPVQ